MSGEAGAGVNGRAKANMNVWRQIGLAGSRPNVQLLIKYFVEIGRTKINTAIVWAMVDPFP